jgi:hypothetical protein
MFLVDRDPAAHDMVCKLVEFFGSFTNLGFQRLGWLHVTKGDL